MDTDEHLTTEQLFSRTKQRRFYMLKRQLLAVAVASVVGLLAWIHALEPLDLVLVDAWQSRPFSSAPANVILVTISAKSIDQIGKWPWPFFRHAVLIELMTRWEARSVYIDHTFSEKNPAEDQAALQAVLIKHAIPTFLAADYVPQFRQPVAGLGILDDAAQKKMNWAMPASDIAPHVSVGHRKVQPSTDRVFRFWKPWLSSEGQTYPFAALKMQMELHPNFKGVENAPQKRLLIPWERKTFEKIERIEFSDLMQSYLAVREGMQPKIKPALFKGKNVFVGLADEAQTFSGITPWRQTVFPVEVMAAVFASLDAGSAGKIIVPQRISVGFFLIVAAVIIVLARFRIGRVFWSVWLALVSLTALVWLMFLWLDFWFSPAATLLFLYISAAVIFTFDALNEQKQRTTLFHLATRDGLTNLYVIRHFRIIMNQITIEARARKEPLGVILLDIDHFKKINDTFGHPAGDMVLKKTADVIQSVIRQKRKFQEIDFIARYGGEEFVILVRGTTLEIITEKIAERIRIAIETAHFEWEKKRIMVTISLGVAVLKPEENIPDPMMHRADKALYLAKKNGRNQVKTERDL